MKARWGLVVLLGILLSAALGRHQGYVAGKAEEAAKRTAAASSVVRTRDTIYRRDTIRLARVVNRYDSIRVRDTLAVAVEVPGKPDTVVVFIPRAAADTAIATCLSVVHSCDLRVAARDTLITALRAQVKAVSATKPGFLQRWGERALWGVAGYGVGRLIR